MLQTKSEKEQQLQKTIGVNLRTARTLARMKMTEVMIAIWGIPDRKNRLSEVENGFRMPSPYVLMRLSVLYNVSLDFIFGLSSEIERDTQSAKAGIIIQGLRATALDLIDQVGLTLAKKVDALPKSESMHLLESAQDLLEALVTQKKTHRASKPMLEAMAEEIRELERACNAFEASVTRRQKLLELEMINHIEHYQTEHSNEYLTDPRLMLDNPYQHSKTDITDIEFFEMDLQDNIVLKNKVGA